MVSDQLEDRAEISAEIVPGIADFVWAVSVILYSVAVSVTGQCNS